MSKEYLTESAVFSCPLGMKYKAEETANRNVKYKGKKLLTAAAILLPKQSPIPCTFLPPLPSGPPPCPCVVGPFTGSVKHKATMNLLTTDSKAVCVAGKFVKPTKSGTNSRVIYNAAHSAKVEAVSWDKEENHDKESPKKFDEKPSAFQKNNAVSHDNDKDLTQESSAVAVTKSNSESVAINEETIAFREGMLCSYSNNNAKCKNCAYRLDNEPATVDNNSATLRKNYNDSKPHTDSYDRYFDVEVEPLGNSKPNKWSYAAHHLISGNQVFKQNAELVRLARFCEYDINNCQNCIMLVGYPEDYPDIERMKSVKAYEIMSESRVQWHVGGHSYTFTEDEKSEICKQIGIRNKINLTPGDIKNYAELVQAEIDKLQNQLTFKKNHQKVCYVDQDSKFLLCEKLNTISKKIKAKIAAFSDMGKPHHSFPFFVSKEAFRYTYALPRTGKVITVLKSDSRLILSMFRLEHFTDAIAKKDKNLLIKPKDTITIDLSEKTWQIECILFCDNVSFFVYLDNTPRDILPFFVDKNHQFPAEKRVTGTDGLRFLEANDTEILVWLRDNPQYGYISPLEMVKNRSEKFLFEEVK